MIKGGWELISLSSISRLVYTLRQVILGRLCVDDERKRSKDTGLQGKEKKSRATPTTNHRSLPSVNSNFSLVSTGAGRSLIKIKILIQR